MSLNYGTLRTKILDDAHRNDGTISDAKVKDFVRAAEGKIARELRAAEMLKRTTIVDADRVTAGLGIYTLPTDYLEERALYLSDGTELEKTALSVLRKLTGTVSVRQYAPLSKTEIEFRGVPSTTEVIDLIYWARPAAFSADADVNAILTNHESIYVNAAMAELFRFTQDLELAREKDAFADKAIETLNEQAGRLLGGAQTEGGYNLCSWSNY